LNLARVDGAMLRQAVGLYLVEAYAGAKPVRRVPDLSGVRTADEVVSAMDDESRRHGGAIRSRRWVLRLGNARYPNMKLALEEYLLEGEFVFTVDTHDEAVVRPGDPDEPAWRELRAWNLAVKRRIEDRWRAAGLPTYAALLEVLARSPSSRRRPPRGTTVLVADDEEAIRETVAAVLRGDGYRVVACADGLEAVAAAAKRRPDLILLDHEMPRMTGLEACAKLRRSAATRGIPVLLATASMLDLSTMADADGFLVKPYQREVLLSFVGHLARPRPGREAKGHSPAGPAAPATAPRRAAGRRRAAIHRGPRGPRLGSSDRSSEE
jgi:CheY-like chemotaxis protein